VAYDEVPGGRDGAVIGELRRGYRLGERLLRPALDRVAKES
jgi:molecular chaperone GrpE (heat shock protein)